MSPSGINPKDAVASAKPDMSLVSEAMMHAIIAALANGAKKYGRFNWRVTPIRAMVYTAAAVRHIKAWEAGEDQAADSGVHHLDHAIASLCIMRDAAAHGTLRDDRDARSAELGSGRAGAGPACAPAAPRYGIFANGYRSVDLPGVYDIKGFAELVAERYKFGAGSTVTYTVEELPRDDA